MRRAAALALAALISLAGVADYEWAAYYMPKGWKAEVHSGYMKWQVGEQTFSFFVTEDGTASSDFEAWKKKYGYDTKGAMAIRALEEALVAQIQLDNLSKTLYEMVNGGLFVDYVDTDGKKAAVSVQYNGSGKNAVKPSDTPTKRLDAGKVKVDTTSIWKSQDGTLSLVWPKADGLHAATPGGWRRFTPGGGAGGAEPDGVSLDTFEADGATNLQVMGFASAAACGENLHRLLAESTETDALNHEVLCRVTESGKKALHYLPLGADKFAEPDGETVEAHAEDGGKRALRVKPGAAGKYMRTNAGGDGVEWSAAVSEVKAEEGSAVKAETDAETGGVTLSFENPGVEVAGTQGASQSGAKLKFEGNADTAVRTTVVKDGDTVKVQIGVYYR